MSHKSKALEFANAEYDIHVTGRHVHVTEAMKQYALEKISNDDNQLRHAHNATAHLFIANPFGQQKSRIGFLAKLFMTHPPIEERIKVLRGMKI